MTRSSSGRPILAMRRLAPTAALAALLSGCMVGPDYRSTPVDVPPAFREAQRTFADSAAEPAQLVGWWRAFDDPTLVSLVERAILGNLDLQLAGARLREARADRKVAAAEWYPQVDAGGAYSRQRASENTAQGPFTDPGPDNLWDAGFDASWEIDVFGRVGRAVEATDARIAAAEETRRDVLVSLVAEVALNYAELRGFQRRIELAEQNAALQADTLVLTQSRYSGGLTSELDVASAAAQLATTRSAIPLLRSGEVAAINRLGVLLGAPPERVAHELAAPGPIPVGPAAIDPGSPEEMVMRRPDLRAAERDVAAQSARVGVATSELYPRIFLLGTAGVAAENFDQLFEGSSRVLGFGPSVTWRVFDGGRIRGNIAVQDARLEAAQLTYRQAVLIALEEVENALAQLRNDQEAAARLDESVGANQLRVELALKRYERGIGDFLSVIEAQRSLTLAEDELARRRQEVARDVAALYKALGGI